MTAKLQTLIVETSETIVKDVDDCLLTTSKKVRVQKHLTAFAEALEKDRETQATPARTSNTTAE